jgi:hypothetical protein
MVLPTHSPNCRQKTANERTEQVQDTIRNTSVEVDEGERSAVGFDKNRDERQ